MSGIKSFLQAAADKNFSFETYLTQNQEQLLCAKAPEPIYVYETISKTKRVAHTIFAVLFFPYGLYRLMHFIIGAIVIPAQGKKGYQEHLKEAFQDLITVEKFRKQNPLLAKRFSVLVNGQRVETQILGRKETLNNGKWVLVSNANYMFMQENIWHNINGSNLQFDIKDANFLFYNYQGVGFSEGVATRDGLVNAHKAMLQFLEDDVKGIGATKIIQRGMSIGGGVQGAVVKTHQFKKGKIKYVLIKEDSFSKLSRVPGLILGAVLKFFCWELDSESSSIKMEDEKIPEIVIQKGEKEDKKRTFLHDDVIPGTASHGFGLCQLSNSWKFKKFILKGENHCSIPDIAIEKLTKNIDRALQDSFNGF